MDTEAKMGVKKGSTEEKSNNPIKRMFHYMKKKRDDRAYVQRQEQTSLKVHKQFERAIKVLLLGTGESGKTTLLKQMKLLHVDHDFTASQRSERITEIRSNLHESIYELARHAPLLQISFDSDANAKKAEFLINRCPVPPETLTDAYRNCIFELWQDQGIHRCLSRSNEFQIIDNAKYFLDRAETILNPNYLPTNEDILRSRKITTGITEVTFTVKAPSHMGGGNHVFRMFDVGGQRNHRNKWLQVFEGIQAVLFVISCSDFDQTLREDATQNRLRESLQLFSRVWHNRFLYQSGIIVFLNKQDVLEEKIKAGRRIGDYFPEYEEFRLSTQDGNAFDEVRRTRSFIRQKLVDITTETPKRISKLQGPNLKERVNSRDVFCHYTVATDTDNIRKVFYDVHDMIMTKNLVEMGLM